MKRHRCDVCTPTAQMATVQLWRKTYATARLIASAETAANEQWTISAVVRHALAEFIANHPVE